MPAIRANLPAALAHEDIRLACCAVEMVMRAGDILDMLPAPALEQIRDYCTAFNKGRVGSFSEFKAAWIKMVIEHLDDAQLRERRLASAVTGSDQNDD